VEVYIQETGEHVIATAGEVHAERCFMDLKEWCGDVQLRISPPLLSFRETIIDSGKMVESRTANKLCLVKIRCTPIPFDVATQLNHDVPLDQIHLDRVWKEECKSLWAIGPKQHGSNLLINHSKMSPKLETFLSKYQKSIVSGFQLASSSGPLCAEPMMGVAFCIEEIDFHDDCDDDKVSFRGQLISAVKDACFESMSTCSKRIVEAIYKCDVHVPQTHVGKVYPVLAKRRAKITSEDFENGTDTWTICCFLPVAESFGFSSELRTKTSGGASPMLVFSHWQVLDIDPSWVPTTQEELEEFGEIGEQAPNLAKTYVDQVRRRKGLLVQEKLVEKGEKQRNLSKKK
jgi:ribosome assembly protein 1